MCFFVGTLATDYGGYKGGRSLARFCKPLPLKLLQRPCVLKMKDNVICFSNYYIATVEHRRAIGGIFVGISSQLSKLCTVVH